MTASTTPTQAWPGIAFEASCTACAGSLAPEGPSRPKSGTESVTATFACLSCDTRHTATLSIRALPKEGSGT